LVVGLLQVVLLSIEGARNAPFVLGVLKVNNIVGFDFLLVYILFIGAVLNEFPQAFALVFVDDRNTLLIGLFDHWAGVDKIPSRVGFGERAQGIWSIKVDRTIVLGEVHEAVSAHVVDQQFVVEVNWITIVLIAAVGINFPDNFGRRLRTNLNGKGTITSVSCLQETFQIGVGFDMSEDGFSSIGNILPLFEVEIVVHTFDFALRFVLEILSANFFTALAIAE
jgi:hypothetical protein